MQLARQSLNLLFPPQCGLCREIVTENGSLCSRCWQQLNFIAAPICELCGYPHEFEMGEGAQCAACIANMPAYHAHRSALYYDENSKRLIHDLKYYDRPIMVSRLAQWMRQAAPHWFENPDTLLLPIPLHRFRLWKRKYNQSALLANALAKQTGLEVGYDLLRRTKHRPPQASLSRKKRLKNIQGSLSLSSQAHIRVKSRPVILIDDVMTTGATLNASAKLLKKADAARVFALTIARTVLDK